MSFYKYIELKLEKMQYWKGERSNKGSQPYQDDENRKKPGPFRKLSFLDEFLLVLMRLKAGLLVRDFVERFGISISLVSRSIASVRIDVERATGLIITYHILDGYLPNTLSPYARQIATVCGLLTNFLPPLLPPAKPKP